MQFMRDFDWLHVLQRESDHLAEDSALVVASAAGTHSQKSEIWSIYYVKAL
jgi:hypothetical protein